MTVPALQSDGSRSVGRDRGWWTRVLGATIVALSWMGAPPLPARDAPGSTPQTTTVWAATYDGVVSERWDDPAIFVLRRSGLLPPQAVTVSFGGAATRGLDYTVDIPGSLVRFGPGQTEVWIEVSALADDVDGEGIESITLTVLPGRGYTVGSPALVQVELHDQPDGGPPGPEEAVRFLSQATFGAWQDADTDVDQIPEDAEVVMALGFSGWIADQFARPVGLHQPFVEWVAAQPPSAEIYLDPKQAAWWGRAMDVPRLRPDAPGTQLPDPLRQRVAFALSEILVISDRLESIAVSPEGMANYYDVLVQGAFGNYRDLLRDVALHPCMGLYLSHLGNRAPDPVNNVFPDENFARELLQLFTIGLWWLHPDGTPQRDAAGQLIPTYDNGDITEFARVFTGLAFGGSNQNFALWPRDFTTPMKAWDAEHDCNQKTLLLGTTLPARTPSPGSTGAATMADVEAALDNVFEHPNVGPFLARQLIQRLVSSNPTPGYIRRVAAAFDDDGFGGRGNLKAVIEAILLDPEARDPSRVTAAHAGKVREPFLRCVAAARAFAASSQEGWYYLDAFQLDHAQEPLKSPSVFNFYLPTHSPSGPLAERGLVAPELQIVTASSGVLSANYFFGLVLGGLHRWGQSRPERVVRWNLAEEMALNVPAAVVNDPYPSTQGLDPDALLRRLDLALTGGALSPENYQIIREALLQIGPFSGWNWPRRRLDLAIYLILQSPEFQILR